MTFLWLDDDRDPKDPGWHWVRTAKEAIWAMENREPWLVASLDHDLGPHGGTGYQVVLWMAENNVWPTQQVLVHTHNPVGAKNMCATVNRYGPYKTECIWTPYGSYRHAQVSGHWEWLDKPFEKHSS